MGGVLAAISADPVADSEAWLNELDPAERIGFPVLSDSALQVARAYGVVDHAHGMALPALVVVGADDGTIRWKRISESIADRPDWEVIRDVLAELPPPQRSLRER